jgi:hypothetical protein
VNTTAVFVEILIIGLQACAWVALALADLFGTAWIAPEALKGWEDAALITGLAGAYVLGIFVDRAADSAYGWLLLKPWGRRLAGVAKRKPFEGQGRKRLYVLAKSEGIARFVDYQRSRVRIARATVLNAFLILLFGVVFLATRTPASAGAVLLAAGAGVVLWIVLLRLAERIAGAADARLDDAYDLLRNERLS